MKPFAYIGVEFTPYRALAEDEPIGQYMGVALPQSPEGFDLEQFYVTAKAADEENGEIDLFFVDGWCVIPSMGRVLYYAAPELPEHCIRNRSRTVGGASFKNLLACIDDTGKESFYPTPPELAEQMVAAVNWNCVRTVLEPSAGKGDLVRAARGEYESNGHTWYRRNNLDIDCIEINPDLQAILRDKGCRVVYDDFLDYHTFKSYDLIFMNPPFADSDRHLMKALEMQCRTGGQLVCVLNAETLRNPCTRFRKELIKTLDEHDAAVTWINAAFEDAERPTDVSVALVSVTLLPPEAGASEIYDRLHAAATPETEQENENRELAPADYFERIVREYNVELAAGMELIRIYKAMQPHIMDTIPVPRGESDSRYSEPILKLTVSGNSSLTLNGYVELTRYKYWAALLYNPELTGKLTSKLRDEWRGRIDELAHYEFDLWNIKRIAAEINAELRQGVEDSIMALFEQLTVTHCYNKTVNNENVHYYNGWCANSAYRVNKKVIIPSYGIFPDYNWSHDTFYVYKAYSHLADIEKALNYLDGHMTAEVDLHSVLTVAESAGVTRNIRCKYFDVTFYKKGTTHIKFTNAELLEKFNIYASRKKNWLPPSYGRTAYRDMPEAERAVVDDFQGKEAYEKVYTRRSWYLAETSPLAALPEPA